MKVTAETRFKHAGLRSALRRLNWSQSELARRVGCSPNYISFVIRLLNRPSAKYVQKIEQVFLDEGIVVDILEDWPETFRGFKKAPLVVQTNEVTLKELAAAERQQALLPAETMSVTDLIDRQTMYDKIGELPEKERRLLEALLFEKTHTLVQYGEEIGRTPGCVRQQLFKAVNKLCWNCFKVSIDKQTFSYIYSGRDRPSEEWIRRKPTIVSIPSGLKKDIYLVGPDPDLPGATLIREESGTPLATIGEQGVVRSVQSPHRRGRVEEIALKYGLCPLDWTVIAGQHGLWLRRAAMTGRVVAVEDVFGKIKILVKLETLSVNDWIMNTDRFLYEETRTRLLQLCRRNWKSLAKKVVIRINWP